MGRKRVLEADYSFIYFPLDSVAAVCRQHSLCMECGNDVLPFCLTGGRLGMQAANSSAIQNFLIFGNLLEFFSSHTRTNCLPGFKLKPLSSGFGGII